MLLVSYVGLQRAGATAFGLDGLGHLPRAIAVAVVVDPHERAVAAEGPGAAPIPPVRADNE
jgi:hypothetical protein